MSRGAISAVLWVAFVFYLYISGHLTFDYLREAYIYTVVFFQAGGNMIGPDAVIEATEAWAANRSAA